MNSIGYYNNDIIYICLYEMLYNRTLLHDKYGESGYIIHRGIYYIFQPFLLEDNTIQLYYRCNHVYNNNRHIQLQSLVKRKDIGTISRTYSDEIIDFTNQRINANVSTMMIKGDYPSEYSDTDPSVKEIYEFMLSNGFNLLPQIIYQYYFDRLSLDSKAAIMYGFIKNYKDTSYLKDYKHYLENLLLFKDENDKIYFNLQLQGKDKSKYTLFGIVLSYNNERSLLGILSE